MWPTEFVWQGPLPEPRQWGKPGVVMFFNLECPACISRAIPFLKRLEGEYQDTLNLLAVHTSRGHKHYSRDRLLPTLTRFVESFARLPFPVALDIDGGVAEHYRIEGTPHWLVFAAGGELLRSIYGSQGNARTRLEYLLGELLQTA